MAFGFGFGVHVFTVWKENPRLRRWWEANRRLKQEASRRLTEESGLRWIMNGLICAPVCSSHRHGGRCKAATGRHAFMSPVRPRLQRPAAVIVTLT